MTKLVLTTITAVALLIPAGGAVAQSHPEQAKGPKAESKAKAYGKYCKDQSRKHVKGTKGTDFSRCVTAMAKADRQEDLSARQACSSLSKKHIKGEKGTAFSRCVVGVAQMRGDS